MTTTDSTSATKKPPLGLRLEADLHEWIKEQAKRNERSMQAEITVCLKQARQAAEERQAA